MPQHYDVFCPLCGGKDGTTLDSKSTKIPHYPVDLCVSSLRDRLVKVSELAVKLSEELELLRVKVEVIEEKFSKVLQKNKKAKEVEST